MKIVAKKSARDAFHVRHPPHHDDFVAFLPEMADTRFHQTNRCNRGPKGNSGPKYSDRNMTTNSRDLLSALLAPDPTALVHWRNVLQSSRRKGDRKLVARAEDIVRSSPDRAFTTDASGQTIFKVGERNFHAGRFGTRSIGELRQDLLPRARDGSVRLWALLGQDALTDIGALQAWAGTGTLFQVASQFNCLEATGASVVPVRAYFSDPTQGPRASISAFPGTLLRHYGAPGLDGSRFVQTDSLQINLLHRALPTAAGTVRAGYLVGDGLNDPDYAATALSERFDQIQVGVHAEVEVVLGCEWDGAVPPGCRIAQVFTSTFAGGHYSPGVAITGNVRVICRQLLRAAYLGTLLAAAGLNQRRVVLTLIGGGVFGNPHELIWEAICSAVDEASNLGAGPMDVVVNARNIDASLFGQIKQATAQRNGKAVVLG